MIRRHLCWVAITVSIACNFISINSNVHDVGRRIIKQSDIFKVKSTRVGFMKTRWIAFILSIGIIFNDKNSARGIGFGEIAFHIAGKFYLRRGWHWPGKNEGKQEQSNKAKGCA